MTTATVSVLFLLGSCAFCLALGFAIGVHEGRTNERRELYEGEKLSGLLRRVRAARNGIVDLAEWKKRRLP